MKRQDMTYEYRRELLEINAEARRVIKPPRGESSDFIDKLNFEYNPTTHEMLFCWVIDRQTQTMWLGRLGKWFVFHNATPETVSASVQEALNHIPLYDREQSIGCGVLVEQITKARQFSSVVNSTCH